MNLVRLIFGFPKWERPLGVSKSIEYLILISVIFSSYVFFKHPFEFYFHYLIFLGLLPFLLLKYRLQKFVLYILSITFLIGFFNAIYRGFELFQFIKVWGGLSLSLTFYSLVIQYFKFDLNYFFKIFLKWSYLTCLIGVFQVISYYAKFYPGYNYGWILNKWGFNVGGLVGIRINSIFSEPSTIAVVIAPAAYIAMNNLIYKKSYVFNRIQSLIVLFVYIGTSSSTAFIGLFLILLLLTQSFKIRYALVGLSIAFFVGWILYSNVEEFKSRIDSSFGLWVQQQYTLENTNTSSFVLYNNFNVAIGSFSENPIFGTGLGSYQMAYEKYTLTRTVIGYDFEFNKSDGNSMFLRLMVETGTLGLIFIGLLLYRGFIRDDAESERPEFGLISQAILVMIALYLLRQGNYFLNALPLFYLIYYYNWRQYLLLKSSENLIRNENRHLI